MLRSRKLRFRKTLRTYKTCSEECAFPFPQARVLPGRAICRLRFTAAGRGIVSALLVVDTQKKEGCTKCAFPHKGGEMNSQKGKYEGQTD